MNVLNQTAKYILLSVLSLFSFMAHAISLDLPATNATGSYSIPWSGASYEGPSYQNHSYVKLEEKIGSTYKTLAYTSFTGTSGSYPVSNKLNGTYTYRVTDCPYFSCGSSSEKSIVVTLPKPIVTAGFSTNPINESSAATLTWSAANATSCSATGISGVSGISGSVTYTAPTVMTVDQTLNIPVTCVGTGGSTTTTATATLHAINDLPLITSPQSTVSASANNLFTLSFTVSDEETAAASLTLTSSSSDQSKIPNGNIVVDRANNRLNITPIVSGTATVTLRVTDSNGGFKDVSVFVIIAPQTTKNDYTYDELGRVVGSTDAVNGGRYFTYDAVGNRVSVQVSVGSNRPPVAGNTSVFFTAFNTPTYVTVPCSDPDGDSLTIVSYSNSGAVAVNYKDANGFSLVGVGGAHAFGSVTYTISDGKGLQATGVITTQNP